METFKSSARFLIMSFKNGGSLKEIISEQKRMGIWESHSGRVFCPFRGVEMGFMRLTQLLTLPVATLRFLADSNEFPI